jgi:hypothetical protein
MLEGLDSIDWLSLTHAHGPATDVPDLIRSLLSEDAEVWMRACADLHETIWHQGTVFPASAAAIPFLFELLTHPGPQHSGCPEPGASPRYRVSAAGCAVSLLCCIAAGEGYCQYVLRVDGEESLRRRLAKYGRSPEEALEEDRAIMETIQREVSAGCGICFAIWATPRPIFGRRWRTPLAASASMSPGYCRPSRLRSRRSPIRSCGRRWLNARNA